MANIIQPERPALAHGQGLSFWLSTKFVDKPLAMLPNAANTLKAAIDARTFDAPAGSISVGPAANRFVGVEAGRSRYRVTDDHIAIVPVAGMLIDRGTWLGDLGGFATTYEGLCEQFRRIAADVSIKAVVLDIDSPGGMVSGLFDLCGEIAALDKKRPVYAIAQNMACSAAYAIAASARESFVTINGEAGSIGVITVHQSMQRMLDQFGVDTTIIHAGSHKADGNPFQQLSHTARADMAANVDQIYSQFVSHVAKARGLSEDAVRGTEARVYAGRAAVDQGLVDGVKSFDEVLSVIRKGRSTRSTRTARAQTQTGVEMSRTATATAAADMPQLSDAECDALIAGYSALVRGQATAPAAAAPAPAPAPAPVAAAAPAPAPVAAAPAPAPVAAAAPAVSAFDATSFAARCDAIINSEAGKKRPQLALHLALKKADMPAAEAIELLAIAPEESAAAAGGAAGFFAAMRAPGASAGVKPDNAVGANSVSQVATSAAVGAKPLAEVVKGMHQASRGTSKVFGR